MRLYVLGLILIISMSSAEARVSSRAKRPPAEPTMDIEAVNNPATRSIIARGAKGAAVLRAQILLDRAHFSVGEIDGNFGENMEHAVKAYQAAHGMQPDGVFTPDLWVALNVDTAPALTTYTIAPQDTAGPFVRIPAGVSAQSRLSFLGYQSTLEELGERFHTNPRLLQRLNPAREFEKSGEKITVPNTQRLQLLTQPAMVVVKRDCSCVEVFDSQNSMIAHYPASIGSIHDPLPTGDWKLEKPIHNPVFHYNPKLFWDARKTDPKRTLQPGPNNPVGLVWIPLTKEHYGIHGTPEPSTIGKKQSHGCIRLTNWDISELANLVKPGTTARLKEN